MSLTKDISIVQFIVQAKQERPMLTSGDLVRMVAVKFNTIIGHKDVLSTLEGARAGWRLHHPGLCGPDW